MEPPAVTTCSEQVSLSTNSNAGSVAQKAERYLERSTTGLSSDNYQLQIDASSMSYNSVNRPFEELPENFLETISPPQAQTSMPQESPQLASLAPMSLGTNDGAYATLAPMSAAPSYANALKMEPMQEISSTTIQHGGNTSSLDKLSGGPAGLLSPLHNARSESLTGLLSVQQNGSRSGDAGLTNFRRGPALQYIKEEVDIGNDYKTLEAASFMSHHQTQQSSAVLSQEEQQQELDNRLVNAETPPAVSNVELASSFLATIGEQTPNSPVTTQSLFRSSRRYRDVESTELSGSDDLEVNAAGSSTEGLLNTAEESGEATSTTRLAAGSDGQQQNFSTKDVSDPLNAEIDDDIYIDTKDLCRRIAWELKQHSIPQAVFAERILCRSQGTLSDLLRNPKPWNKLKSGRETFRRMFNWVQQPLETRLAILEMCKGKDGSSVSGTSMFPMLSPPTPAQNARQGSRHRGRDGDGNGLRNSSKRPRLVFTDIQKRTLQAIFKETQRPSREMQQTIAEHLNLDLSTVANFFMNARRRSRCGPLMGDVPAPYQHIRAITPPPDSPPSRNPVRLRRTSSRDRDNITIASTSRIETTVAHVAEQAAEYARRQEEMIEDAEMSANRESGELKTPTYKMIRLTSNNAVSLGGGRHLESDLHAHDLIDDGTTHITVGGEIVKAVRRDDNVFVVVPVTHGEISQRSVQQQQDGSVQTMSFASKLVTLKVENDGDSSANAE